MKKHSFRRRPTAWTCHAIGGTAFLLLALCPGTARAASYYVNDAVTNGDVYCTAVGNDGNPGTNAAAPKLTLTNLLASYTLMAGDIVRIDTGTYSNYTVNVSQSGVAGTPIVFQGSTNYVGGGSVFRRNTSAAVFFLNASHIELRDLTVRDGGVGVSIGGAGCVFYRISALKNSTGFENPGFAGGLFQNCIVADNNSGFSGFNGAAIDRCVLWSNGYSFVGYGVGSFAVSNSAIVGGITYSPIPASADYNVYWNAAFWDELPQARNLSELQRRSGHSMRSLVADPNFVDPANHDFHPRSLTGRFNPVTGAFVATDTVHSVLIDFGSPVTPYADEPWPNGTNANAGAYGNTREASKSRTSAWILAISLNDGGTLLQTGRLHWAYGNMSDTNRVKLEYSTDSKASWKIIVTNHPVTNLFYTWDASSVTSSVYAYWRVTRESSPAASDTNDNPFALRGRTPIGYYVNDTGTVNDVYTSGPGLPGNDGLTTNTPKDTIQGILDSYSLAGGHVIYVDTGYYTGQTVTVSGADRGGGGEDMLIQGSTNMATGGTVLNRGNPAADVLVISGARNVAVQHLTLAAGRYGASVVNSSTCSFESVSARFNTIGFQGSGADTIRFLRCASLFNGVGASGFGSSMRWDYGVMHSNTTAFVMGTPAQWSVSNSIIAGGQAFSEATVPGRGDYNLLWNTRINTNLASLSAYQKGSNAWWNSAFADPLFVNSSTNSDFHLRSVVGTWSNGARIKYATHSPAIDFGDPLASFGNETWPNGTNVDAGSYGNTAQASWSRTNAWLLAMNYNDGGTLNAAAGDVVRWRMGNMPVDAKVRVELSLDGGATWVIVATNLSAASGSHAWSNTNYPSTTLGRWRVVWEALTNVVGATTHTNFTFQNGSYKYYVNDLNSTGDVYCTGLGSDTNTGTSAGSPKYSLKSLVEDHEIQEGDIIYMDTGYYEYILDQEITGLDGGATNLPVTLLGSTNYVAGGTRINRRAGALGLELDGATYYDIRDLVITNAGTGVRLNNATGTRLTRVTAGGNGTGIEVQSSSNVVMDRCVAAESSGDGLSVGGEGTRIQFLRGVLWNNRGAGVRAVAGQIAVSNCAVVASGASAVGFHAATTTNILGDYNALYVENSGIAGYVTTVGRNLDTLGAWVAETGQDRRSLEADPLFADASSLDFHLKTDQRDSRWITGTGWNPAFDAATSPLIDAGDPTAAFTNETPFNGARINIGLYGNAAEASKRSSSNWIHAASLRQGGWVRGTSTLHWVAGGAATGHFVKVEFSPDGGQTWMELTNRVAASAEIFAWNTWAVTNTPAGAWRVTSTNQPSLTDRTTNFFAVRNLPLSIYVNNPGGGGTDVYCSGPGAATNWEATAAKPLDSLARAMAAYNLEPGDRVYVDTGVYTNGSDAVVSRWHSGLAAQPVLILGSTNWAGGGTVLVRTDATAQVLRVENAQGVVVSNLNFRGGRAGVQVRSSSGVRLSRVSATSASNGIEVLSSTNVFLVRAASYGNTGYGLHSTMAEGLHASQSVLWSNKAGAVRAAAGSLRVTNNVLEASGEGTYVYSVFSNAMVQADYNDILVRTGAYVAVQDFYVAKALSAWKLRTTNDLRSLSHEPHFFNAPAGDFHPRSSEGRYNVATGVFVADTTNSPLIDTGHRDWAFAAETGTNGARVNIGLYGNDDQASRSRTNAWLLALSFNDGGTVRGTSIVYFVAGGAATNHFVTVDFTWDDGVSWTNVATNVLGATGWFEWNTTRVRSTTKGRLQFRSQSNSSVRAETEKLFTVNNEPLTFYVNDSITNGDVYTLAPGQSYNDGTETDFPVDSVLTILGRYDPQPGDRIFIDTGVYLMSNSVSLGDTTEGALTNLVLIQGSTNQAFGGTLLDFQGRSHGLVLDDAVGVGLRNLRVQNAWSGVKILRSADCVVESVWVQGAHHGFEVEASQGVDLYRCASVGATTSGYYNVRSSNVVWRNGVLWSNQLGVVLKASSVVPAAPNNFVAVSNSVVAAFGEGAYAYYLEGDTLRADRNALFLSEGARMARTPGPWYTLLYDSVARWASASTQDVHSLAGDPGLCDPGALDFHPLSPAGRYVWAITNFVTTDTVASILIDAAPVTGAAYSNETSPNGLRADIGMYGNHREASRAPTNAAYSVLSFNDGGVAAGSNVVLRWLARGAATGHTARIEYSATSGQYWQVIAEAPARQETQTWNTLSFTSSLFGIWRVTSTNAPFPSARNVTPFALRNTNFLFFVNDGLTNGDVYTAAAGADAQTGRRREDPKPSIQGILDAYDLEGGDVIYVDTGVYTGSHAQATVTQFDSGAPNSSNGLSIVGSTNVGGGSILDAQGGYMGLQAYETSGTELRHFTLVNVVTTSVRLASSRYGRIADVHARGGSVGFSMEYVGDAELRNCSAAEAATGLRHLSSSNVVWQNGVLWSNTTGVLLGSLSGYALQNNLRISNSVIAVFGASRYAYDGDVSSLSADYNDLYLQGAYVARRAAVPFSENIPTLSRWILVTGQDAHSLTHEPGFFQPPGDFHLLSRRGRFSAAVTNFVDTDTTNSVLLDAGGPTDDYAGEPDPNGARVNIGVYGNTTQASKTPTNARLTAASLNDGGIARGTNYTLYWVAAGAATGHTVYVSFSGDGGATWTEVSGDLPAGTSQFPWDTTLGPSTLLGQWEIRSRTDTSLFSRSSTLFAVRNDPILFYVNDANPAGDVYTSTTGSPAYNGLFTNTPKDSLQGILDAWDVEPGDIVYVDTGVYTSQTGYTIGQLDAGDYSNSLRMVIQGSTNEAAGGTVLVIGGTNTGFTLNQAEAVALRHLTLRGADIGISLVQSRRCLLEWLRFEGGGTGVNVDSAETTMRHCVARDMTSAGFNNAAAGTVWESGVLWSNRYGASVNGGSVTLSDSIIVGFGTNAYAYRVGGGATLAADFNNIHLKQGARAAFRPPEEYPGIYFSVSQWARATSNDVHSLTEDPLFADGPGGNFRLKSQGGRFLVSGGTTNDTVTSPLLDAATAGAAWTNEADPNGGRRNIGLYGNSGQASKTPTNARLHVITLNDGGRAEGVVPLYWAAQGDAKATGRTVRLWYSSDAGAHWQPIVTNIPASAGVYYWETATFTSSIRGAWAVESEQLVSVRDTNDVLFALRNERLKFYVNNDSTNGNVYTTAPGNVNNSGATPADPLAGVQEVLDRWDLEPGDTVYVDTGEYDLTQTITMDRFDAWEGTNWTALAAGLETNRVVIQGSTNILAGGTLFRREGSGYLIHLNKAPGVGLRHLKLQKATSGLRADQSRYGLAEWVSCESGTVGFDINNSDGFEMHRCVARNNSQQGLYVNYSEGAVWRHGILWMNGVGAMQHGGPTDQSSLTLDHSVLGASGDGKYAFHHVSGRWTSDYNNVFVTNSALPGVINDGKILGSSRSNRMENIFFWSREMSCDSRTLSEDPKFANAAAGDFHLRTTRTEGRYDPALNTWTNDADFSPLIDAGNPESALDLEPGPNGSRVNIGLYGNTVEASKTPTNAWVTLITLRQGGSVQGEQPLYWVAGGAATGMTLYLQLTLVSGLGNWTNVATNVLASAGGTPWNSYGYGRAAAADLRIASVEDSSINATSLFPWALRDESGSIWYFVNNNSTNGDVYTTEKGQASFPGTTPYWPKPTIQSIISTYKLEPVDIIWVDTGEYGLTSDILINDLDSGSGTNRVTIQGSTNWAAGGTVLNRQVSGGGTAVIRLDQASGINLRDLTLIGAQTGLKLQFSQDCSIENVRAQANGLEGFALDESSGIDFRRCVSWKNGGTNSVGISSTESSLSWSNGLVWGNATAVRFSQAGDHRFRNSVLQAVGAGKRIFSLDLQSDVSAIDSEYNNLLLSDGATVAEQAVMVGGNTVYGKLVDWQKQTGLDQFSLSHAPQFADEVGGDFRPKSAAGRFRLNGTITNDTVTSPLIDTGDPSSTFEMEENPNGSRVNIGPDGNASWASLSSTDPWLLAISINAGGTIRGTNTLLWTSGNMATSALLRLEYTRNGGAEWFVIASNVVNVSTGFPWDVSAQQPTVAAKWRVIYQPNTNVRDEVDAPFIIKNAPLTIYVNDASTNGDVYCRAPGSPAHSGLTNNAPLHNPAVAMLTYALDAGDRVFIDTGEYTLSTNMLLGELNRGTEEKPIQIIGSTNYGAGGSLIKRDNNFRTAFLIQNTRYVEASDLRLTTASIGLEIANLENGVFRGIQAFKNRDGISVSSLTGGEFERCAAWSNRAWGVTMSGQGAASWRNGVFWGNQAGAVRLSTYSLDLTDSIIQGKGTSYLYFVDGPTPSADYNILWKEDSAILARDNKWNETFMNLQGWQRKGSDVRSALVHPAMNEPERGDFTLRSTTGRYSFAVSNFVRDAENSWAIDASDPASSFASEFSPNGGRANAGLFGGTRWASKSTTNPAERALLCASLNDGGMVMGAEGKVLYWLSRGLKAGDLVKIEFSANNGVDWTVIASNQPATLAGYPWDAALYPSTPLGRWRVSLQADPAIHSTNQVRFILRNAPVTYYVNDGSRSNDVYTSAIGLPTNDGLSTNTPKSSIQDILAYDLESGDTILVDTGWYPLSNAVQITTSQGGDASARVKIVGSTNQAVAGTNWAAGRSVLGGSYTSLTVSANGIEVQAQYVEIAHLTITNVLSGVALQLGSGNGYLHDMIICDGRGGISVGSSSGNRFERMQVVRPQGAGFMSSASSDITLEGSVIWGGTASAVDFALGDLNMSNSILYAAGSTNYCLRIGTNATIRSDYNVLFTTNGASVAMDNGLIHEKLLRWTEAREADIHSVSQDPKFANPATLDFHLRSVAVAGRYVPGVGWTNDVEHSPAIDTGAPQSPFDAEKEPNGGRRNIGLYGGTAEASKSLTNAWLKALTADSGGRIDGVFYLAWAGWSPVPTNTVRVEYSYNDGADWTTLVQHVVLTNYIHLWNSTAYTSPISRWRVVLHADTNVRDTNDTRFALNGPFSFFINDTNRTGDIYTDAIGSDANVGFYRHLPKATMMGVLTNYDLDGGDSLWIDTGTYFINTNSLVLFSASDQGSPGLPIDVTGSTNAGGSLFSGDWVGPSYALWTIQGGYLRLSDLGFEKGSVPVSGNELYVGRLSLSNASVSLSGNAVTVEVVRGTFSTLGVSGSGVLLRDLALRNGSVAMSGRDNTLLNALVTGASDPAVSLNVATGAVHVLQNATIVGTGTQVKKFGTGNALVENNIIGASGDGSFCLLLEDGTVESDYNMFYVRSNAWIGNRRGNWERLLYWQRASGQDENSLAGDPLFADEAAGDYHLQSLAGRWTGTNWTNDVVHSPCIDAGNPATVVVNEPPFNGFRVNLGAYGNSTEASRSRDGAWLRALTMNDGGVLKGTNVIRWTSGLLGPGDSVCIQYSTNNWASSMNVACGIPANQHRYTWDTTLWPSSLRAWWRVVLETNTAVYGATEQPFAVRNSNVWFYVNDSNTANGVYTTQPGRDSNDGLSPSTPKATLQNLLDTYDTEGGDIVYVDTGFYTNASDIRVIWSRGGEEGYGDLLIQGSTNYAARGSVITRSGAVAGAGLNVKASRVRVRDLTLRRNEVGLLAETNVSITVERLFAVSNLYGLAARRMGGLVVRHSRFWNNEGAGISIEASTNILVEHSTLVGYTNHAIAVGNETILQRYQNNIFYLGGTNPVWAFRFALTNILADAFIDYNVYHFDNPGTGFIQGTNSNLMAWQLGAEKDYRSSITNPLFANVAAGDFHLRSAAGRWVDGSGWTTDAETSWAIDKANPESAWTNEPWPNGARANIGAYGNTEHASRGSSATQLVVRTLNQSVFISDTNSTWPLVWHALNIPTNLLVAVQYSGDAGATWVTISNNVPVYREYIVWPAIPYYNTFGGYWRVVGVPDTNYWDTSENPFGVFIGEFAFTREYRPTPWNRVIWRGAWNASYKVQVATNVTWTTNILSQIYTNLVGTNVVVKTNAWRETVINWFDAPSGTGVYQQANFISTVGGDVIYDDPESTNRRYRLYRVIQQ